MIRKPSESAGHSEQGPSQAADGRHGLDVPGSRPSRIARWSRRLGVVVIGGILLLLAARLIWFQGPVLPVVHPWPEGRIVDLHCHTAGIGAGGSGCFVAPTLRNSYKFRIYLKAFGVTEDELEAHGDGWIIERIAAWVRKSREVDAAVILALDGVVDEDGQFRREATQVYIPNEFIAAECARFPALYFGASIHPYRRDALARLEAARAAGAVLVKWIPAIQGIDPASPRLRPFYERLAELGLPLLTHTGNERSFTEAEDELGDPERLRMALDCGVTVIAAHVASTGGVEGERYTDRLLSLMSEYPNLYADISSLTQLNKPGYLAEALTRPELRGRLLYGTDFPLIRTPLVSAWNFPLRLTFRQMWKIQGIANPWDRDVALKRALGTPPEIFFRTVEILPVSYSQADANGSGSGGNENSFHRQSREH